MTVPISSLWNANFWKNDVYKQFLNRVTENTKIVQGKAFMLTNNYDLSNLKK